MITGIKNKQHLKELYLELGENLTVEQNLIISHIVEYEKQLLRDLFKEATEDLYALNRKISVYFIMIENEPKKQDMQHINKELGEVIKKLRSIE